MIRNRLLSAAPVAALLLAVLAPQASLAREREPAVSRVGKPNGGSSLLLRVNPAIGAPGGVVAVVLRTYAPRPVRQGQITVKVVRPPSSTAVTKSLTRAGLTQPVRPFLSLLGATVYSTQGDTVVKSLLEGQPDGQVTQVAFESPSGTVNAADGPLAVFFFQLDPAAQPGDTYDLSIEADPTWFQDESGQPVNLTLRPGTLTVRDPSAPYSVEAAASDGPPGSRVEAGVTTAEPFPVLGGRITLLWDPRIAGAPTVRLDPRYGQANYTVDSSKPGRLVVEFESPDASFNRVPGMIVSLGLPIAADAPIGATSPFRFDPDGTWLLGPNGKKLRVELAGGTFGVE